MEDSVSYYIPVVYVQDGKVVSIPTKVTYFYNSIYKFDRQVYDNHFPDYASCDDYCKTYKELK